MTESAGRLDRRTDAAESSGRRTRRWGGCYAHLRGSRLLSQEPSANISPPFGLRCGRQTPAASPDSTRFTSLRLRECTSEGSRRRHLPSRVHTPPLTALLPTMGVFLFSLSPPPHPTPFVLLVRKEKKAQQKKESQQESLPCSHLLGAVLQT